MDKGYKKHVLDHGYVTYIDSMGTDETFVEAARMSTGRGFVSWSPYERCKTCECPWFKHETHYQVVPGFKPGPCCDNVAMDTQKFPNGDFGTLEYLYSNHHMTPFEMCELVIEVQAPIMVFREWHRHRTQCLAGNTRLHFDLPGGIERRGTQKYAMTIKEVFEKFQPTVRKDRPERQTNALFPRQRLQNMRLRCVNEETKEVTHTTIVDVWESGTKPVYEVEVEGVGRIRCSKDHRFFTTEGWKTLEQLADLEQLHLGSYAVYLGQELYTVYGAPNESTSFEVPAVEVEETWRPVVGWEEYYEVSCMGRVRRIAGGQGVRTQGTTKKLSPDMAGYLCTTLNRPGTQIRPHVHRLVLEAFVGPCPEGMECRHVDGNQQNNWISNLKWGTSQENAEDRVRHGRVPSLKTWAKTITSVKYVGEEMTYDIEVADPWHNFVAEGFVVHNSYNEFSARYAQMPNLHYIPEMARIQKQSAINKQSSDGSFEDSFSARLREYIGEEQNLVYAHYEEMIGHGVAKEIARINTPVSRYSKMRAKADIRCWLSFLLLRKKPNAQWEIRQFADAVGEIIMAVYPRVWELFEEYTFYAESFSRKEMLALREMAKWVASTSGTYGKFPADAGLDEKKTKAFYAKLGI